MSGLLSNTMDYQIVDFNYHAEETCCNLNENGYVDYQIVDYSKYYQAEELWGNIKENHEDNKNTQYPCSHCKRKFPSPERMKVHMLFHTGEKSFPCQLCCKKFQAMTDLIYHCKGQKCKMETVTKKRKRCRRNRKHTTKRLSTITLR